MLYDIFTLDGQLHRVCDGYSECGCAESVDGHCMYCLETLGLHVYSAQHGVQSDVNADDDRIAESPRG